MQRTVNGSRLLQMKEKFQQKQMAERELKIASLYEAQQARALDRVRMSPSSTHNSSSNNSTHDGSPRLQLAPGKVRQMFEERRGRSKAGIDKSYPLQPIQNTTRTPVRPSNNLNGGVGGVKAAVRSERKPARVVANAVNGVRKAGFKTENLNGSGDVNHNSVTHINNTLSNTKSQPNPNKHVRSGTVDRKGYLLEDETFPETLAEEVTPRSPEPKKPARRSVVPKKTIPETQPQPQPVAPVRKMRTEQSVPSNTTKKPAMPPKNPAAPSTSKQTRPPHMSSRQPSVTSGVIPAGIPCSICQRRFAPDRIQKHEEICKKSSQKKRKPFDALKHRLAGTEAEPFINRVRQMKASPSQAKAKPLNSTWRQKHDDFINAIRSAKQVQQHLAAGGKLSDLPPPPPSENPDYIQCPHCNRRFNQAAAERHIPKCASFQHNKPKPAPKKR